jgi:hypothetical protein
MEPVVQELRAHLEARDLGAFLTDYEAGAAHSGSIEMTTVTQRILPGVLLEQFGAGRVTDAQTVQLWRLVRSGRLVLVDDVLLEAINERLHSAWLEVHGPDATLPEKLLTLGPDTEKRAARRPAPPPVGIPLKASSTLQLYSRSARKAASRSAAAKSAATYVFPGRNGPSDGSAFASICEVAPTRLERKRSTSDAQVRCKNGPQWNQELGALSSTARVRYCRIWVVNQCRAMCANHLVDIIYIVVY